MRTGNHQGKPAIARSTDGGKSFGPWVDMGFVDRNRCRRLRVGEERCPVVSYGYRRPPYGIRARLLNADCSDFASAPRSYFYAMTEAGWIWVTRWSIETPGRQNSWLCYYFKPR